MLVTTLFFLFSEVGFATDGQQHPGVGDAATASKAVEVIQGILQIVSALLGTVTAFVSLFLSPGWTSGQIFNMQVHLKEIWILVSNVVYFMFAMILIAIAFMNIIGKWDNKWELKAALPRFIIGILIVPFSWFFVQFVVSVSAILTVWVLTLPYDTFREYDFYETLEQNASEWEENDICIHPVVNLWSTSDSGWETIDKLGCEEYGSIFSIISNGNSIFGIVSIYTYGVMSPEKLDELRSETLSADTGTIAGVADLLVKVAFDLIFIIIYFILMAALFLALFVRWVWLWIYMMLSPAFGLLYFFEKWSEWVGWGETKFSIKEFVSLALIPVYVSAALSFGLLFIFVATHGIENDEQEWQGISIDSSTEWEETITLLWDYNFTIRGFQWSGPVGIVAGAGSALGSIIVQLFGLVILWIAVMAALKWSETTGKIIAPIEQFGTSVWKLVASAPSYAPIIPTGSGGLSAQSLPTLSQQATTFVGDSARKRGVGFLENNNLLQNTSVPPNVAVDMKTIRERLENWLHKDDEIPKFSQALSKISDTKSAMNSSDVKDIMKKLVEELKLGKNTISDRTFTNEHEFSKALAQIHNASLQAGTWELLPEHKNRVNIDDSLKIVQSLIWGSQASTWGQDDNISSSVNKTNSVSDLTFNVNSHIDATDKTKLTTDWINEIKTTVTNTLAKWSINKDELSERIEQLLPNWINQEEVIKNVITELWEDFFKNTTS